MGSRSRTDARDDIEVLLRTGPFHGALRAAIEDSGLTLDRLRHRLAQRGIRVSLASLSHWQQGRSRPERADSLRAVREIENILGLPRHSLAALLGPPRPRGRWVGRARPHRHYDGMLEPAQALAQTVEPVLGPSDAKLRVFWQEDVVTVGVERAITRVRTRLVLRAVDDDADRHLAVYCAEADDDPNDMAPIAVENCRIGRVRRHPHAPVIATELLFDRRLRAGETHLLEYEFAIEPGGPSVDYRRAFRYPADTFVLAVRFTDPVLPVRCHRFAQHEPYAPPFPDGELMLASGRSVHLAARDVRPGVLGISWEWE